MVENNDNGESRQRPTVISFRVTPAEAKLLEHAAAAAGESRAGWVRTIALRRARAAALREGVEASLTKGEA